MQGFNEYCSWCLKNYFLVFIMLTFRNYVICSNWMTENVSYEFPFSWCNKFLLVNLKIQATNRNLDMICVGQPLLLDDNYFLTYNCRITKRGDEKPEKYWDIFAFEMFALEPQYFWLKKKEITGEDWWLMTGCISERVTRS